MVRVGQFEGCAWKENGGVARFCIKRRMPVIARTPRTIHTTGTCAQSRNSTLCHGATTAAFTTKFKHSGIFLADTAPCV
jgi:hypothetical protein